MSNLVTTPPLTMSSKEIADLVGKRHDNVKRTIETLAKQEIFRLPQIEVSDRINNLGLPQRVESYLVGKRDSYVIVAQLSPQFTARLVDRWQELEEAVKKPAFQLPDFTNPSEAARAWADQFEGRQIAEEKVGNLTRHNKVLYDELNYVTVDQWRTSNGMYWGPRNQGMSISLGRFATGLCKQRGIEVGLEVRDVPLKDGRNKRSKVNVYPRAVLDEVYSTHYGDVPKPASMILGETEKPRRRKFSRPRLEAVK